MPAYAHVLTLDLYDRFGGAGMDLKTAQTRLGHSDARLTLAVYAQATTAGDDDAADALGEASFGALRTQRSRRGSAERGQTSRNSA